MIFIEVVDKNNKCIGAVNSDTLAAIRIGPQGPDANALLQSMMEKDRNGDWVVFISKESYNVLLGHSRPIGEIVGIKPHLPSFKQHG